MRVAAVLFLLFSISSVTGFKEKSPQKTKKYKCFQLADDEEVRIVKKDSAKGTKTYSSERAISRESKSRSAEDIELPLARKFRKTRPRTIPTITTTPAPTSTLGPTPPNYPKEVKRDSQGRPLILSPDHCAQVKKYATSYGVADVLGWVRQNCRMAQMFVPGATCEDINTLVESCYSHKYL